MKRLLALLLALTMVFSMMTVMTGCESSDDRRDYEDRDDENEDADRDRDDEDEDADQDRDDVDEDNDQDRDEVQDDDRDKEKDQGHSGTAGQVATKQEDCFLAEMPVISDSDNLREDEVQDAYGNDYAGPYFELCSYGDAYRDGEYITQAYTEFNLAGKYRYLTGTFFTRAKQKEEHTIEFMVYADDELVYCSEPISRKTKAVDFAIDIGNCDVLRITSRSYDYTGTSINPGIVLVNAQLRGKYTGTLTQGVTVDPKLVPLTDLHIYGTDSRGGGDNVDVGPVLDSYGNLYKGIYLELVSWGNGRGEYDKQAYSEFVNNGGYRYLSGTIFARPEQSEKFTIEFLVYADDELVYSSGPIDRSTKAIDFVVEIGECDLIRVQTRSTNYTSVGSNPGVYLFYPTVSVEEP